tara:strand:- start:6343 stop:6474 length:132 start_codon:yes stop_codon:yes gene_type:complete
MKRTKDIALEEMQKDNDKLDEYNEIFNEALNLFEELFEQDLKG